jgi:hypothetical protein
VLGAIGLILPELLRITRVLTPVAAAGLTIIMVGATVITVMGGSLAPAVVPFVVGVLLSVGGLRSGQGGTRPGRFARGTAQSSGVTTSTSSAVRSGAAASSRRLWRSDPEIADRGHAVGPSSAT